MKLAKLFVLPLLLTVFALGGCDENNNVISQPEDPGDETPTLPCEALGLNLRFNIGQDIFAVYENGLSSNVIHVFSSGSEVFIVLSNDDFAFGFSGPPTMDGQDCDLNVAMADFDKDGMFDETATMFTSTCAIENNGFIFTLFPNEAVINASDKMADAFQTFESTEMDIQCKESQVVSDQTFFEGLIKELGYTQPN
ncbi:MAG: hypothetical protein DHS20C13_02410 [Thermodesulfobacteriota bacterium]|nr:MAG: hypothetical protein DHS20C13_02410 [Thermodesulfobacteriota bacterium]